MDCGVDEQLVVQRVGSRGKSSNAVAEPRVKNPQQGVLPMTKQHFRNLNSGRRSDESRYGGADGTLDTTRASFAGHATASRGCAEGGSISLRHSIEWQSADIHW